MEPQRKAMAGPMAPSSIRASRKSSAVKNTLVKSTMPEKEVITVHTSTPTVEKKSFHAQQTQVFQGQVNLLSIMYSSNLALWHKTDRYRSQSPYKVRSSNAHIDTAHGHDIWDRLGVGTSASASAVRLRHASVNFFVQKWSNKKKVIIVNCSVDGCLNSTLNGVLSFFKLPVFSERDTSKEIMCCKYTEDQNDIAAGFTDGTIRLFNCNTGACTHSLVDDECRSYPGPVTAIKHRPVSKANPITNMLLSSYVNGTIKCWKYKYDQCLYTIREKRQTLGLNYHPRYSKFVTYGDDAKLNMYDEEAQTQERAFYSSGRKGILDGHTSRIFSCVFNPKSNHELISGGWDDTVMCWDDRQPYATKHIIGVHICGEGLDFDKPGKQILTCSWQEQNCIQIWDYGSCKLIETIVPDNHMSKLYCGKMVPTTNLIVCGGSDSNILRVVDINLKITECSIRNNPGGIYSFDFGTIRRKPSKAPETFKKISEIEFVPRVAFVTGKRLQTVDFG